MIRRELEAVALSMAGQFKALAITGPRQSGKTTLARMAFPGKPYVSLESPDERGRAVRDPRQFLARFPDGGILDEVQRVPELLSYLQGELFENWVVVELLKGRFNRGKQGNLFFWRNNTGLEVDVLAEQAGRLRPVEIKSGATLAADWWDGLNRWLALAGPEAMEPALVYGGDTPWSRDKAPAVPWRDITGLAAVI